LRKNTSSFTSSLERKKQSKKQAGNRIPKDQASKCKKTETDQRKRVPKRKDMIKIVKSRGHERDAMAARLRSHSLYIASSCSSCFCNLPFPHKASDFALHPSLPQPQADRCYNNPTNSPPPRGDLGLADAPEKSLMLSEALGFGEQRLVQEEGDNNNKKGVKLIALFCRLC
jgi:hypothetical protein